MALCLYESLRAVGLQHHYDRLTSVGVQTLAHLTVLTLEDYPLLGIRTMDDRTRLFHLVQVLKTLDRETLENAAATTDDVNEHRSTDKYEPSAPVCDNKRWNDVSSVCRQLDFSSEESFYGSSSVSAPGKQHTKSNQNTTTVSPRRTSNKPTGNQENVTPRRNRTSNKEPLYSSSEAKCFLRNAPVYQSNVSEYNYGLQPPSSSSTPRKRREGERRIWVCIRKRPLTSAEERREEIDVVATPSEKCVIVHEGKEAVDLTHYVLQHRFYFDHVFGEDCSNEDVYLRTAYPLVQHMLSGGSATCFAYGQTGAGKTHTMLGCSPGGPGLYALAVRDIFTHLSASRTNAQLCVFVSFFEIYCGQLYDLLDHRKRLFAREDGQKIVHIAGLCHVRVDSVNSLLEVISRGTEERSQGSSGVNPLSSRSHAMLQIQLRDPQQLVHGRMWFVDLAGSERASDSRDPDRQSRMEGAEINQSLLALKECIRSLDQEQSHTPFRQSKLTQVLKDSFVGDSMTCMIANISPVHTSTEHTLNSLRYADRVKELKAQGAQRRGRQGKTAPSPKRNLSHSHSSSSSSSAGPRGKSPPKKPKIGQAQQQGDTFAPTLQQQSPIRTHAEGTFLSSTPKNNRCGAEKKRVRRLFELISPVKNGFGTGILSERATAESQNHACQGEHGFCNREMEKQQSTEARVRQDENVQSHSEREQQVPAKHIDQEKKRHLKLYHQQLQQFVPATPNTSHQPSFISSFPNSSSPRGYSHTSQDTAASLADLEDFLGRYRARTNHVQPCLPDREAGLVSKHSKSGDPSAVSESLRGWSEDTEAMFRPKCDRKLLYEGKNSKDARQRWAWVTENGETGRGNLENGVERVRQEGEVVCANGEWSFQRDSNSRSIRRLPIESCDQRAPAERPLSPATVHSSSLLTLSALDYSPYTMPGKSSPQHKKNGSVGTQNALSPKMEARTTSLSTPEETESGVMDPLSVSLLEVDQQPATDSFLRGRSDKSGEMNGKHQEEAEERVISVYMQWEQEEGSEDQESYLEVPKAIRTSLIPVAIQLHSQRKEDTGPTLRARSGDNILGATSTASAQPCAVQTVSPFSQSSNDLVTDNSTKTRQYQTSDSGHSQLSGVTASSPTEESSGKHLPTSEDLNTAHWHIVQAHLETLKEMKVLSHKEGTLLLQQPEMAFTDYVQQLEQIMARKALCVQSMISQLQPYLNPDILQTMSGIGQKTTLS